MKKVSILFLISIIGIFLSCEKDNGLKFYSITGKAQKGPFVLGTIVTINELNSTLGQTGKSFTTSIISDDGSFNLTNVELSSNYALLSANGFYFSEIYGQLSNSPINLQAIVDLTGNEAVNINVFTHIIKDRIMQLVSSGLSFHNAKSQAQSEFLSFLGYTGSFGADFDNLDISASDDYNAVLLSFSIILQKYSSSGNEQSTFTAELVQLLSNLSSDFATDGVISNKNLIDALLYNISQLNMIDTRNNIERRYSDLGQIVSIPNFEKYIAVFQAKYSDNLYTDFTYPVMASPDPVTAPDGEIKNILVPSVSEYQAGPYSVAAIVPLNNTLKVKIKGSNIIIGSPCYGWELINEQPNGFTINSQKQNQLMSMLIHLESSGSATIEYYENDSSSPTYSKVIQWQ